MEISGRWSIEEMDLWDRDALDLVQPAFIEFGQTAPAASASSPSRVGWTVTRLRSTGSPVSSSAGRVMTTATKSAGAAGQR